jgi:hypothetical protein
MARTGCRSRRHLSRQLRRRDALQLVELNLALVELTFELFVAARLRVGLVVPHRGQLRRRRPLDAVELNSQVKVWNRAFAGECAVQVSALIPMEAVAPLDVERLVARELASRFASLAQAGAHVAGLRAASPRRDGRLKPSRFL